MHVGVSHWRGSWAKPVAPGQEERAVRALHIAPEYPPIQVFGLGRAVHDLAVATARLGHEVHVITNGIGGRDKNAVVDGVRVHRISFPPPPKPPDSVTAVVQFDVLALRTPNEAAVSDGAPDVIHVHDRLTALPGRVPEWLHPTARLVVTVHDTTIGKHFGQLDAAQQFTADVERWISVEADAVICCSEYVRNELTETYGVSAGKIAIVPCAVDRQQFVVEGDLPTFRETFAGSDEPIVLYVGRLDREKGIQYLTEAFAPAYYEDTDYCFRAREAGFRVVYSPYSEVHHHSTVTAQAVRTEGPSYDAAIHRNDRLLKARWGHRFW